MSRDRTGADGAKASRRSNALLRSLVRDKRANTLAIGAAAILPIIGVIGGGVDASRMYLAQSRLQQACDAATLAARKKLAGDSITGGVIPTEIEDLADNFFEVNFTQGMYGTGTTTYELSHASGTRLDGTAQTSVPVTLMKVFGFDNIELDVDCSADLNLPNIDISLVLDMSGSMNDLNEGVSQIDALKSAVFAFYDEIMAVAPADARVRIAIVPYNSNMNVGNILNDLNADYLADTHQYQTREANFETVMTDPGSPAVPGEPATPDREELYSDQRELVTRDKGNLGSSTLFDYAWSNDPNHSTYGSAACNAYDGTYTVNGEKWVISDDDYYRNYFRDGYGRYYGACEARVRKYRVIEGSPAKPGKPAVPPTYETRFKDYTFAETTLDTSSFKKFETVTQVMKADGTPFRFRNTFPPQTWDGCIEEATTVATTDFDPIPAGAYDLDIDLVPDSANKNTQWRPLWNAITEDRNQKDPVTTTNSKAVPSSWQRRDNVCPPRAYALSEYKLSGTDRNTVFENRINALTAGGSTMHDLGVLWGARLLSPDGIFSSTNRTAPNGDPIIRHMIFMTDGAMSPGPYWQNAYGNPDMDGHLAGFKDGTAKWRDDWDGIAAIHNARLDAICEQAKNKGITIWTVSFNNPLNNHTRGCASDESRAMTADNQTTLITRFRTIATSIAELRLVE
ncbi:pilus assembly protein TadG-related protein [Altererythrobacter sp. MTPC7]|uniref:pilus assembly protein TadG-related protein n=1 Tax=Altererythrobacter sp. MTPC7 TaxID=3056567 RepID=UPI0036F289E6